jgi:hypothetical protein
MPYDHRAYQPKLDFTRDAVLVAPAPLTVSSEATDEATTPLASALDAMLDALAAEFRAIESEPDPTMIAALEAIDDAWDAWAATLDVALDCGPESAAEYSQPTFRS